MGSRRTANEIKEKALAMGAKAAGIASVKAINRFAPPGHRPSDLLKGAQSVVVVGGGEPTAGAWRTGTNRVLGSIGYNRSQLASAARQLSYFMEERYGYYTLPIPTGDWVGHYPYMSLKVCAELAGLGTRSMAAGILLNSQYGLLYFNGVITTMPLPEDGPLGKPVCPHDSCVRLWEKKLTTPCLSSCPDCLSGEIKDGKIRWMEYRQDGCYPRAQTTAMDAFRKLLLEAVNEPDPEQRKAILFGSHFTRAVRSMAYSSELSAQCFNCLKRCPVVMKRVRRLK
jgi:epoxyqueuosine reductase QueG